MGDPPFIHATAEIDEGARIGEGTRIWGHTHVRSSAVIGAECIIGEHAYVDIDVTIGSRVKIQNQALVFGPATIADGVFIGPGACLTNDRSPRAVTPEGEIKNADDWDAAGVSVGEGASIGARATIVSGITIGAWSLVGAGAVVTEDVAPHAVVVGVPARQIGLVCRCARPLDDDLACSAGHRFNRWGESLEPVS